MRGSLARIARPLHLRMSDEPSSQKTPDCFHPLLPRMDVQQPSSQALETTEASEDEYSERQSFSTESTFEQNTQPHGSLTLVNGLALVISLQIGAGIFSAPSQVSQFVTAPGYGVLAWFLAGLLVWTGAASFIELGLQIPENGGVQEYLRCCYGEFMGFMFTWNWIAIRKPAAVAIIATVFADYLCHTFSGSESASRLLVKCFGVLGIAVITFMNCLGATTGAKAANVFLVLKLGTVASIILIGSFNILFIKQNGTSAAEQGWFQPDPLDGQFDGLWSWFGGFVTATFGALFCYGGWETIGFVLGDMKNPKKDLPLVSNGAMLVVIISFVLLNITLYLCLPMAIIRDNYTVVVKFAEETIGRWASYFFSIIIAISALGAVNANVFATAKLCVAASHRHYFPRILANMHCNTMKEEDEYLETVLSSVPNWCRALICGFAKRTASLRWQKKVPIFAMIMNGLIASFYVMIGSFNSLVTFIGIAEYFFWFFAVLGVFVLRRRPNPERESPTYRTWAGNPIIFAVVSGMLILRGVLSDPLQGLMIFGVGTTGLVIFYKTFGRAGFQSIN
ncbi:large neutral amino acids transporter small subunit 1 [Clohesyomyces aquaticus]|uniref:Large neutral amino acids transporter small subunit 1 n=1 Tax=Clohesyomyces aquaticus TaxID=1231657 RepID=A0A1Y2A5M3_9PLEO|nr:large neutral amino acids transporter small subunit 1 [Clohesyomyces aquaticus]